MVPMTAFSAARRASLLRLLSALPAVSLPSAPAWAADDEQDNALTATARLLAGIEPATHDERLRALATRPAWRRHRSASSDGAARLKTRLDAMDAWRAAHLPDTPAGGGTLIYPFSGPDFVNAYALFPDRQTYVFFSLEEPGRVPRLGRLDDGHLEQLLQELRAALNDLVHLNFFITPNMQQQLRASSLRGVAPVLLATMAALGLRIERVQAVNLWPERVARLAGLPATQRPTLPLRALQIDFRRPDRQQWQTLLYLSLDVSDRELRHYPEFVPWLRGFDAPAVLLKSASYLLHGAHFRQVRDFILDRADLLVQDDTGLPYRTLADGSWSIALHGEYEQPVRLFEHRYQSDLAQAFRTAAGDRRVPFPFGYNWRERGNSFVIVARRDRRST